VSQPCQGGEAGPQTAEKIQCFMKMYIWQRLKAKNYLHSSRYAKIKLSLTVFQRSETKASEALNPDENWRINRKKTSRNCYSWSRF